MKKDIVSGKVCPYCFRESVFVDSSLVYSKSYGMIYLCRSCDAYVGVHKGTNKSLGRLANRELRAAKKEAHNEFDKLWKSKLLTRSEAYSKLSKKMRIEPKYTHIGMFDVCQCLMAISFSKRLFKEINC